MKKGQKHSQKTKDLQRQRKLENPTRYWLGKKLTDEHNAKLQEGKSKYPHPNLGKKLTLNAKKRISESLKKKYANGELVSPLRTLGLIGRKGKDAMNWQGGKSMIGIAIRRSTIYRIWQKSIWERDNFTCKKCKNRGGKLHAHHIQNFSQFIELRFAIDNGITFCNECHKVFHKTFGFKNNNYQQVIEFLTI